MLRRALALVALAAAAAVAIGVLARRAPAVPAAEGSPAPPLTLRTLQGRRVDLAALRGRVVAVNFWASWCAPCRQELPELAAFAGARGGRCFDVLGVAAWSGRDDVGRLAATLPYPVLLDDQGEAVDAWKVGAVPRTYVVDAEGRIRREFRGALERGALEAAVKPLLPESCPAPAG